MLQAQPPTEPEGPKGPSQKFAEACETKNVSFILNPPPSPLKCSEIAKQASTFHCWKYSLEESACPSSPFQCRWLLFFFFFFFTCAIIDPSIAGKFLE